MRTIIIRQTSPLKKEEWDFFLVANFGCIDPQITFDSYYAWTKRTPRHRWRRQLVVKYPPLPDDVVMEARLEFIHKIMQAPIIGGEENGK